MEFLNPRNEYFNGQNHFRSETALVEITGRVCYVIPCRINHFQLSEIGSKDFNYFADQPIALPKLLRKQRLIFRRLVRWKMGTKTHYCIKGHKQNWTAVAFIGRSH